MDQSHDPPTAAASKSFERLAQIKTSYQDIPISLYKSRETGLSVLIADVNGPIVHGVLTLATEIFNDSGCPHVRDF
jgi:hypothetical protein